MVHDFNTKDFFHGTFNVFYSGVAKLQNFTGICHNYVVVLFVFVRFFKLCQIFAKLMFPNQVASQQQIDGIVKRRPTYAVIFILHFDVERLYIKVAFIGVNFIEYGKPFRSFTVAVLLQIGRKNLLYFIL